MEIEVNSGGLDNLVARFGQALGWYMRTVAQEFWGNLAEESPVKSGNLAGSWQLSQISPLEWGIRSGVGYAGYVWEGTKPHEIMVKNKAALRFVMQGRMIFAQRVHHPGTQGNPFVERSLKRVEERLEDFAAQAVDRMG